MTANALIRKLHYWASITIALPVSILIVSGLFLPGRGVAKVWLHSGWEAQVDLGTGAVLQTAYRRSDLIESIHDGSFFAGNWTKLGVFLPTGVTLLFLWGSGLWLFFIPIIANRRRVPRAAGV